MIGADLLKYPFLLFSSFTHSGQAEKVVGPWPCPPQRWDLGPNLCSLVPSPILQNLIHPDAAAPCLRSNQQRRRLPEAGQD